MMKLKIYFLILLFAVPVFSENGDPFADPGLEPEYTIQTNEEAIQQYQSNGTEGGKLRNILTNERPEWDTQNDGRGREYKAESAEKDSNKGKNVAAATGAALIATGSGMVPSPILAVKIAGINLIIKGTIELAQSGADSGSEGKNEGQKNMLLDAAGDLGDPLSAQENKGGLSDDARNALAGLGVQNPDDFAQRAAAGEFNDPRAAMEFLGLGDPSEITDADIAAAQDIEAGEMKDIFADQSQHAANTKDKLTVDETQGKGSLAGGGFDSGSGKSGLDGGGPTVSPLDTGGSGDAPGRDLASLSQGSVGAGGRGDFSALDRSGRGADKDPLSVLSRNRLLELGIRKKQRGQNIFTVARYHYRRYDGWRHDRRSRSLTNSERISLAK